jgi:phosphoribosyl 1,2-cyclic phosphodiesterase
LSFTFQSLCSGSSGNCLLLKTNGTTLLIDAGFPSIRGCRKALGGILSQLDGAVISHLHTDHIQYSSLRVLEESRIPIYVCEKEVPHLAARHYRRSPFLDLKLRPFLERPFQVGDFSIRPFRVPHDGVRPTFGFEIILRQNGKKRKVVVATDFWHWQGVSGWFEDADFIYVEANHDREMLRANPNPRSHFHLSNENCGRLLRQALGRSKTLPDAIMLGHLSEIRNRLSLARDTVLGVLNGSPYRNIPLLIAPRYEPSEKIEVMG